MTSQRIWIRIGGLGCGGSGAQTLERVLTKVPGVDAVYVNPATETAYITYDRQAITIGALLEEVRSAGYRPVP